MTEKRQTSQGYIIRILKHFATKLRNITNFCPDLSRSKFHLKGERSIEFYVCTSSRQQSLEYQSGTTKNLQLSHSVRGASENIFKFLSCLSKRKVTFTIKQSGSIMNILTLRIIATRLVAISTNKPSGLLEA